MKIDIVIRDATPEETRAAFSCAQMFTYPQSICSLNRVPQYQEFLVLRLSS